MNKFIIEKNIDKIIKNKCSKFLNPDECEIIINILYNMGYDYKVFYLFEEAEKLIIYKDRPNICLFEIKTNVTLTHKQILGTLFSHNISDDVFGDIIIGDTCYIVVLNEVKKYMKIHFNKVGKNRVELIERRLSCVSDYHLSFKDLNINVTSLRIDNIISKLINISRKNCIELIRENYITLNYAILKNSNYNVKNGDVFSIRGIGKFKFICTNMLTKTNKYNVLIKKYK